MPDLLFVGLSATDGVGHHFGPHSVEQLDNHLRLDNQLMRLIDHIEKKVGNGNAIYVFSSDHGALELPRVLEIETHQRRTRIAQTGKAGLCRDLKSD